MGEWAIGQPVPRFEDPRLVRGEGRYVGDMMFPGTVPGYVLRSPHAHAKIKTIDVVEGQGRARRARRADRRGLGQVRLRRPAGAVRSRSAATDRRSTSRATGRWRATACAGSATTSPSSWPRPSNQAMDAAELIEVDYEPLPADRLRRRCDQAGRAAGVGRLPEQHLLRASRRRQGQDRRGLREGRARRQASLRDQPRDRREHGAARLASASIASTTITTRSTPRSSATSRSARSCASSCSRCRSTRCASSPATSAARSA